MPDPKWQTGPVPDEGAMYAVVYELMSRIEPEEWGPWRGQLSGGAIERFKYHGDVRNIRWIKLPEVD